MHPDWEAIGAIGEIVDAGAVALSLLFLGHQLRQNTRSVSGFATESDRASDE
jgi:hypothetical protein